MSTDPFTHIQVATYTHTPPPSKKNNITILSILLLITDIKFKLILTILASTCNHRKYDESD